MRVYTQSIQPASNVDDLLNYHIKNYDKLKSDVALAKKKLETAEKAIKNYMIERGLETLCNSMGGDIFCYPEFSETRFDSTRFKKDHPDLVDEYMVTKNVRRFRRAAGEII